MKLKAGKLPLDMLSRLLGKIDQSDPRVVLGPKAGEDAAVIDFGDRYLVAKTDPITFATDLIGWYVVQINANDLAVMGAEPRWLMVTLLLPEHTDDCRGGVHLRPDRRRLQGDRRDPRRRPHRGNLRPAAPHSRRLHAGRGRKGRGRDHLRRPPRRRHRAHQGRGHRGRLGARQGGPCHADGARRPARRHRARTGIPILPRHQRDARRQHRTPRRRRARHARPHRGRPRHRPAGDGRRQQALASSSI